MYKISLDERIFVSVKRSCEIIFFTTSIDATGSEKKKKRILVTV